MRLKCDATIKMFFQQLEMLGKEKQIYGLWSQRIFFFFVIYGYNKSAWGGWIIYLCKRKQKAPFIKFCLKLGGDTLKAEA